MSTWRASVKICPVPLSSLEPFDTLLGQVCAHCVDLQAGHSNTSTCSVGMVEGAQAGTVSQRIPQVPHSYHLKSSSEHPQAYSPSPSLMVQAGRSITTFLSPSVSLVRRRREGLEVKSIANEASIEKPTASQSHQPAPPFSAPTQGRQGA